MLTQEEVKEILYYYPDSGLFYWKILLNGRSSLDVPVGVPDTAGHLRVKIRGKTYGMHQLAWLYIHGSFPPEGMEIDHNNRIKSDNRIDNLRLVTRRQNVVNVALRKDNTSGWKGVTFNKSSGKWLAQINVNGKRKCIGRFSCPLDAASAYNLFAYRLHGEYAYLNRPEGDEIIFA